MVDEPRRRVYTSFQDLSPGEYMYIPPGQLNVGRPGSFSRLELVHIGVALLVLTVAFALSFSATQPPVLGFNLAGFLRALPLSLLGMLTGFIFHELSHKFTAQRLGLWSEFRIFPLGLVLSVVMAFFTGFVFAAPGAVMFRGGARAEETGRIASAGPLANVVVAGVLFAVVPLVGGVSWGGVNLDEVLIFVCLINALLAVFNLLPVGPLDGRKVLAWNGLVWAGLMAVGVVLVVGNLWRGVLFPGL